MLVPFAGIINDVYELNNNFYVTLQLTNLFYHTLSPFGAGGSRAALVKFSEVGLTDTVFNFLEHTTLSQINGWTTTNGINDLVFDNGNISVDNIQLLVFEETNIKIYWCVEGDVDRREAEVDISFHTPINLDIGLFKHQLLFYYFSVTIVWLI